MSVKLHTILITGNVFQASNAINRWGLAEYLVSMVAVGTGHNTAAVFRMPSEKVHQLRAENPAYGANPNDDDYTGPPDPFSQYANVPAARGPFHILGDISDVELAYAEGMEEANTAGYGGMQLAEVIRDLAAIDNEMQEIRDILDGTGYLTEERTIADSVSALLADVMGALSADVAGGVAGGIATAFAAEVNQQVAQEQAVDTAALQQTIAQVDAGAQVEVVVKTARSRKPSAAKAAAVVAEAAAGETPSWALIGGAE